MSIDFPVALVILGGLFVLLAILGGGIGGTVTLPPIPNQMRVISAVIGALLWAFAGIFFLLSRPTSSQAQQASQPSPGLTSSSQLSQPSTAISSLGPLATATFLPTQSLPTETESTVPTNTPALSFAAVPKSCADVGGVELLTEPWHLESDSGPVEKHQPIDSNALQGKDTILVIYDLHGLEVREGDRKDESAIIFDQPNWHVISLSNYGQNGKDGEQVVSISLSDFIGIPDIPSGRRGGTHLNPNEAIGELHTRFWRNSHFVVDIISICAYKS